MRLSGETGEGVGSDVTRDGDFAEATIWLNTREASSRLGMTLQTLYRFIDEGDLVAYKFGRVIRLKQEDVDRFIENCRIRPGELDHLHSVRKVSANRESANRTLDPERGE